MSDQKNESKEKLENSETTLENEWMIRPCSIYDEEYSECVSLKARFHQYFIFGKALDCSQWKRDSNNCYRWTEQRDVRSAKELVESEKARRKERLEAHYDNDIWVRRKEPPKDWSKPLPEYLQKQYESSYLNQKAKEMRGEVPPSLDIDTPSCVIM